LAEKRARAAEQPAERVVVDGCKQHTWIDALEKEDLGLVDVADAGNRPLNEERFGDAPASRQCPQAPYGLVLVPSLTNEVRTEPGEIGRAPFLCGR
jgi:hypothetical protein